METVVINKFHLDMTDAQYRELPGINQSTLKEARRSMAHYRHAVDTPREDCSAFQVGRCFHSFCLEPDEFLANVVVYDGKVRRGANWDDFQEENEGKEILTVSEMAMVEGMGAAVLAHPVASGLIAMAQLVEAAATWIHPATGMLCKMKIDGLTEDVIFDLKSTADASPREFQRSIATYGYHLQAAHYQDGVQEILGSALPFVYICVEKESPHMVAVYELDDASVMEGKRLCDGLMAQIKACDDLGVWPGYGDGIQEIGLPVWAYKKEE